MAGCACPPKNRDEESVFTKVELPMSKDDYQSRPLTLKFYARHDARYLNCDASDIADMKRRISNNQTNYLEPFVKPTLLPLTTNQNYGWYHEYGIRYKPKDRGIFTFPRDTDPLLDKILQDKVLQQRMR